MSRRCQLAQPAQTSKYAPAQKNAGPNSKPRKNRPGLLKRKHDYDLGGREDNGKYSGSTEKIDQARTTQLVELLSGGTNDFESEMRMPERLHQREPGRQQHFGGAGFCDIAKINNVSPTEVL